MTPWKIRGLGVGLLAGACALNAAPAWADSPTLGTDSGDYTALIMGHAFLSQPDATYMQEIIDTYVDNPTNFGQAAYNVVNPVSVYTPETDYNSGLTQGIADLNAQLQPLLTADPDAHIVVASYSMSTAIETQEMINLAAAGVADPNLKFVLAENLQNPDGGYFTRFPEMFGATLPATPGDTPYDTTVYTIEYSGASDFPQYYGNLFADINAADGYLDLHPYLLTGWPAYFDPSTVANAVLDPNVSAADTNTDYYTIPTQDLPMLDGLHGVGMTNAFSDMIQPDMRVLVDLGYDWTGNADVATAATLSNPDIDFTAVDSYLAAGADQGMIAALVDMGLLPSSDLSTLYPYVPDIAGLEGGSLTNDALAATVASESLTALTSDLAGSSNPLVVDLGSFLPGMATDLANYFQLLASAL
jgi:diacyltrehalose acyltransferase